MDIRILIYFLLILLVACKKESTESTVKTYSFKGILYDSLTGYSVPNNAIYMDNVNQGFIEPPVTHTNLAGEFQSTITFDPVNHTMPYISEFPVYISAFNGLNAGISTFKLKDLSTEHPLNKNIYLTPVGILRLDLTDTTQAPNIHIAVSSPAETTNNWNYNAANNNYADTTLWVKVFGNSKVLIIWNNGYKQDSAYVASGDTVVKSIYY